MNRIARIATFVIVFYLSLLQIAAAGAAPAAGKTAPAATPAPTRVADPLAPRYEATLTEGIDFKKPGYPNFLAEVSGMSGYEPWGRQSDANNGAPVKFRFKKPLPSKFTLEIKANAFGPNLGKPIKVRVGSVEKTFIHKDAKNPGTYTLVFEGTKGADTIEIVSPVPTSPSELKISADTRKLGVSLISLKIRR